MCSPEIWDLNGFLLSSEQNKIWRFCKSRFLEIKILKQPFLFTYLYSNGQYGILCVDTFTLIVCRTIDCLFASLRFEHIIKWRLVLTYTSFKYVRFQYVFFFYHIYQWCLIWIWFINCQNLVPKDLTVTMSR